MLAGDPSYAARVDPGGTAALAQVRDILLAQLQTSD